MGKTCPLGEIVEVKGISPAGCGTVSSESEGEATRQEWSLRVVLIKKILFQLVEETPRKGLAMQMLRKIGLWGGVKYLSTESV